MKTVIIMCGVSGSGKTTRIKNVYPEAVVCSADYYFLDLETGNYKFDFRKLGEAHGQCLREFVEAVGNLKPDTIVVDNTNTTVAEIAPYAALALAYGYELRIEMLKVDAEVAASRNTHGVPLTGIQKMAARIDNLKNDLPPYWPVVEV